MAYSGSWADLVLGIVARPDQHISVFAEVTVVLTVNHQQVDSDLRRPSGQHIRHGQEDGDPRGPVIGARNRLLGTGPRVRIGHRSGVPMGQEEYPVCGVRPEPCDQVPHRQGVSLKGHMGPFLRDHGVGAHPQQTVEPLPGAAMTL